MEDLSKLKRPTVAFRPIGDRLLIIQDKADEKVGKIYLTEGAREKPYKGTVIKVGDGIDPEKGSVFKPGDKVFYSKYAGTDLKIDGQEYLILKETEVYGILG